MDGYCISLRERSLIIKRRNICFFSLLLIIILYANAIKRHNPYLRTAWYESYRDESTLIYCEMSTNIHSFEQSFVHLNEFFCMTIKCLSFLSWVKCLVTIQSNVNDQIVSNEALKKYLNTKFILAIWHHVEINKLNNCDQPVNQRFSLNQRESNW